MPDKPEPVVLSPEEYNAVPPWYHPHPQGQPCTGHCRETSRG